MAKVLILVHGILGFGKTNSNLLQEYIFSGKYAYFSSIASKINPAVIKVIEPSLPPVGTILDRSAQLQSEIERQTTQDDDIYFIAHSMGGLDSLDAIPHLLGQRPKIHCLVTIGTPFNGSPVADEICGLANVLGGSIPIWLKAYFQSLNVSGGLHDLTTPVRIHALPLPAGLPPIKIHAIAGVANSKSLLFELASKIGGIYQQENDGVVTVSSALPSSWNTAPNVFLDPQYWEVDHGGEVGWIPPWFLDDKDHLNRYFTLIENIIGISRNFFLK